MHASGHETPEARDLYASALDVTWERASPRDDRGTGATVRVSIRSFGAARGGGAGWRRGGGCAGAEARARTARRRRGGDRARARSRARFESLTRRGRAGGREHAPPCRGRRWRERRRGRRGSYRVRRWRASSSSLDALTPQSAPSEVARSGHLDRLAAESPMSTSSAPKRPREFSFLSDCSSHVHGRHPIGTVLVTDPPESFTLASASRGDTFHSMSLASAPPPRVTAPRARVRPRGIAVRASSSSSSTDGADLSPPRPPVLRCVRRPPRATRDTERKRRASRHPRRPSLSPSLGAPRIPYPAAMAAAMAAAMPLDRAAGPFAVPAAFAAADPTLLLPTVPRAPAPLKFSRRRRRRSSRDAGSSRAGTGGTPASDGTSGAAAVDDFASFVAAGIDTFDTGPEACGYGPSELVIGEALKRGTVSPPRVKIFASCAASGASRAT